MSEGALVSLVALLGWLALVAGAWRARRLGTRKTVQLALVWLAIFCGVALLVSLLMG